MRPASKPGYGGTTDIVLLWNAPPAFPFYSPLIQSGIALQVGHFDDKSGNEGVASVYFAKEHFPEENDALKWWQANRTRLQRGV